MNVSRCFLPRFLISGCLLASGLATAYAQEMPREHRGPAGRIRVSTTSGHEDTSELSHPETIRRSRRSVRPASVGFVPQHEKVIGAQYLEEPMAETLPAPLAPGRMGAPGIGAPAMPLSRGRRGEIVGRGAPIMMGEQFSGEPMMGEGFSGEMPFGGDPFSGPGCSSCEGGDCGGSCGPTGCVRDCYPCLFFNFQNLDIFSGVHGFTNPANRGGAGSFGYQVGFNKGREMPCFPCSDLAMQVGLAANFSNFEGAAFANNAALANTNDNRYQMFVTSGVFRRVDWGLQGGVVFDYLRDDWYATMDMTQLRGEVSWVYPYSHEIGFWCATSLNTGNDTGQILVNGVPTNVAEGWEATDMYAFFYRLRFAQRGGEGRWFGGFTGDGDGLIGADIWLPINNNWSFQADYTYLLPKDTPGVAGNQNECWNVAFNMVWSPGFCRNDANNYLRPLFNVANNGSFIAKRRILP